MNHKKALKAVSELREYTEAFVESSAAILAKNRLSKEDENRLHDLEMDRDGINKLIDYINKIEIILTEEVIFRKES